MLLSLLFIVILSFFLIRMFHHPIFGEKPYGARLSRVHRSPNFKDGAFQNLSPTPTFAEGYSGLQVLYQFLFKKSRFVKPSKPIPFIYTSLKDLDIHEEVFIWFGHASYFIQTDKLRFLIDPVFSGSASPIPGSVKAFKGSNRYNVEDLPTIDFLLITHDHYDHLDYKTIQKLKNKVTTVITGLGVGAHLERWGFKKNKIRELDWWDQLMISEKTNLIATPARHFSGRKFRNNNTLWLSFVLHTPSKKIFIGGDSGYDTHFKDIGNLYGPFDFVILENGQYHEAWHNIHLLPEEVLLAAKDLKAQKIIPVHSGKFALALHAWNEPLELLYKNTQTEKLDLATPKIGEVYPLNNSLYATEQWWR